MKEKEYRKYSRREFLKQLGQTGYFLGTRIGGGYFLGRGANAVKKIYEETIERPLEYLRRNLGINKKPTKEETITDQIIGRIYQKPVESMTAAGLAMGSAKATSNYVGRGSERELAKAKDIIRALEERVSGLEKKEGHSIELILAGLVGIFLSLFLKTLSSYKTGLIISELTNLKEPGVVVFIFVFSVIILIYGLLKKKNSKVLKNQVALRKKLLLGS